MQTALGVVVGVLGAGLAAILVVEIIHRLVLRLGRRWKLADALARQAHRPAQVLATLYAMQLALRLMVSSFPGWESVLHVILIALIAVGAWLLATVLLALEETALERYRTDVPDNLRRRRLHTQVVMIRRLTVAAVVVLAVGVALMTFPEVRTLGASLLASAGLFGVIAGLAAQTTLGNVFAGVQLTFSDAVRLDDVVVVEGEWGKVEEITLSHVVVRIWDDRRLILPSSYFTTKPFQNWTRSSAAVLGTVELEVDWSVPVPEVRDALRELVGGSDLWDGRVCVLQVTEAVGGSVTLRALVSATDAPTLWDLRCLVREELVGWVRERWPAALPRLRTEISGADGAQPAERRPGAGGAAANGAEPAVRGGSGPSPEGSGDARVFSGDPDGDRRGRAFIGPTAGPDDDH